MNKTEQFKVNKYHILNSKKQYLLDYAQQLENTIASTWEDNQALKAKVDHLKLQLSHISTSDSRDEEQEELAIFRHQEKDRIRPS